jgi:hypothetical protein
MTALEFFRLLYGDQPPASYLSLWRRQDKKSNHITLPNYTMARVSSAGVISSQHDGLHWAAQVAFTWDRAGSFDTYFGVGLRRETMTPEAAKRGTKRDVRYLPGLYIDIDIGSTGHKSQVPCPADCNEAITLLAAVPLEPTAIVNSGYGLHVYYLFPELFDIDDVGGRPGPGAARLAEYERVLDALQSRIITAAASKGLHVDNTAEAARVLRVVGTRNYKVLTDPKDVVMLDAAGPRYTYDQCFNALFNPPVSVAVTAPATGTPVLPPSQDPLATVTATPPVVAPIPLASLKGKLYNLHDPGKQAMWKAILSGKSFADTQRDDAMQSAASVVAWMAPDNPTEELVDLFRDSLKVWAQEPHATLTHDQEVDKLRDKLQRAQQDARTERTRTTAQDDAIRQVLNTKSVTPPLPDPGNPYTEAELLDVCSVARCTSDELPKRWVIQRGQNFYILTDVGSLGIRYAGTFGRSELRLALPQYLARAPIKFHRYSAKGNVVEKSVDELLDDYATAAEGCIASLTIQESYFDPLTRVFYEAVRPLRPITPKCHADVQAWLEVLGGTEKDKLLDWVATVTRLDARTCALYLSGPPGTGKSLLAYGLARLWTTGAPTELARILDNFNEDLTRCPLVLADEALPANFNGKQTSAKLREAIAADTRTLARKFISNADIHGCIRLVLAANNERLLAFNEDMTPDDIRAISERFLHIDTTSAGSYLATQGNAHIAGWVDQDIIAEHALYLRDTRAVIPGGRWLVAGHTSRVHQSIATRGTLQGLVTEWLVKYLANPTPSIPRNAPIRAGGGKFVVNTTVVATFWDQYIQSDKTPDTSRIARVLKGLSTGNEVRLPGPSGTGVRCHELKVESLYAWANENQVGEPEEMCRRVNAPLDTDQAPVTNVYAPPATVAGINAAIAAQQPASAGGK